MVVFFQRTLGIGIGIEVWKMLGYSRTTEKGKAEQYDENQAGRLGRATSQQSGSNLRAFARSINGGNSSRPAATKIQFEC